MELLGAGVEDVLLRFLLRAAGGLGGGGDLGDLLPAGGAGPGGVVDGDAGLHVVAVYAELQAERRKAELAMEKSIEQAVKSKEKAQLGTNILERVGKA